MLNVTGSLFYDDLISRVGPCLDNLSNYKFGAKLRKKLVAEHKGLRAYAGNLKYTN